MLEKIRPYATPLALLVSLLFVYFLLTYLTLSPREQSPVGQNDYHADEGVWIVAGHHYFQLFFIDHDFSQAAWQTERFGLFGAHNPVMGKYLIGAWLYLTGMVNAESQFPGYDTINEPLNWTIAYDKRPFPPILAAARQVMFLLTMVAAGLFFWLSHRLTKSNAIAAVATMLFVLRPLVFRSSQRAMMEMPSLAFTLLALLLMLIVYTAVATKQTSFPLWQSVLAGIAFGLTLSTKISGGIVFLVWLGWWFWHGFPRLKHSQTTWSRFWKPGLISSVILLSVGGLLFYLLNPALYRAPIPGIQKLLSLGQIVSSYEVPDEMLLDSFAKRIGVLLNHGFVDLAPFNYWLDLPVVDSVLMSWGLFGIGRLLWSSKAPWLPKSGLLLFLVWFGITAVSLLLTIPFNWIRWYILLEPCWALLEAIGLVIVTKSIWERIRPLTNF